MNPEMQKQLCGNFCVVIHVDGTSEVKIVEEGNTVFNKAKEIIGCRFIDHVMVQSIVPKSRDMIEFLVNDEGYMDWGNDPAKVNQIATMIYSRGNKPDHYILGDVVMCLMVDGEEGGDFVGMSYGFATSIAKQNNEELRKKAQELCPRPDAVPMPKVTISSYDSTEDMMRAIRGDKSVKPSSETVLSCGKDAPSEA
jgi:hypothetical protein